MLKNYSKFVGFYSRKYREMLFIQYSGRLSAYEQTVKFFTGGSRKYSANPKKKTGKRYTGPKPSLDTESTSDTESSLDSESTAAPIVGPSTLVVAKSTAKKKAATLPKATPANTIVRPVNRSSLQFRRNIHIVKIRILILALHNHHLLVLPRRKNGKKNQPGILCPLRELSWLLVMLL
jgi:hypothetical protein